MHRRRVVSTLHAPRRRGRGPGGRTAVALGLARATATLSTVLRRGHGGSLPGRVALAVDADVLARCTRGREVVLVSGTNGKTTTTAYLSQALALLGQVASNTRGDNLLHGLVSAAADHAARGAPRLVLEVDEAVLPVALRQTSPAVVVLLNLSRDQLDRNAETTGHRDRWAAALLEHPATVCVANADDVLVVSAVLRARPTQHGVVWVAAGSAWQGDGRVCPACGEGLTIDSEGFRCTCGFARPVPSWHQEPEGLRSPDGGLLPVALGLPGAGNRGNAALAVAAAQLLGAPPRAALAAAAAVATVQGRYSTIVRDGRVVELRLAKNPAGWRDTLDALEDDPGACLVLALNARAADGRDPSWLYDVPFERLDGRAVAVVGERRADLSVRLRYAGVAHTVCEGLEAALAQLPRSPTVVVGNYTAFQQARALLGATAA